MRNCVVGLYVEIISLCNQHCIYCYNEKGLSQNNFIRYETFDRLTDEIKNINLPGLTISGGEPFIHTEICDLILNVLNKNLRASIVTNGTIYNEDLYKLICDYSISLQLTLDGADARTHDYTRGKGSFAKVMSNICILHKMGYQGSLSIRMNLHKKNFSSVKDVINLSKRIGASDVTLSLINTIGGGQTFKDIITNNDFEILKNIKNQVNELKQKLKINILFEADKPSIGCPYYGDDNIQCGLRISPDGYVYPCQLFNDSIFSIGNIKNDTLIKIINGDKMANFLSLMKLRKYYIPECNDCAYKCMCYTGCPAEAYNKNGNIFTVCGRCSENKKEFNKIINKIINLNAN